MKRTGLLPAYLRESAAAITCVLLLVTAADLVLLTSFQLGKGLADILYLNVLFAVIAAVTGAAGFLRFRARYRKLRALLQNRKYNDYVLPPGNGFYASLLRDVAEAKNEESFSRIGALRSRLEELNDYITKWVHEIKIPVSVCELIVENIGADGDKASGDLRLELGRMRFLINQVLYAARASQYERDLAIGEFDLSRTVIESIKRNSALFIRKNIEVVKGPLDFTVINDEKWVSYILDQILNNAGKYTGQDGRLDISADEDGVAVRLHIRDNGIGIAEHDIGRIFEKGFTGENVRGLTKSTGMGLYYSKTMADKLGMGLEVSSRLGGYTEFTLVFKKINDVLRF